MFLPLVAFAPELVKFKYLLQELNENIWLDADFDNIVYFVLDANCQTKPNKCQDSFSSFLCKLD